MNSTNAWIRTAESGRIPDWLIRFGIRQMLRTRLKTSGQGNEGRRLDWLTQSAREPIALQPQIANAQHYEVAPAFFEAMLGPHLKYSSAYWPEGASGLAEAEEAMLRISCERAEIQNGQRVLDLGCGWGSLSLWIAEKFPDCSVQAMSNSKLQREFIEAQCARRGIGNLQVITADINHFAPASQFDRIVSVEMFEHLRNWPRLLARMGDWLHPGGKLFVHVFCHRKYAYPYEDGGPQDWMARHFFTGGIMPSYDLLGSTPGPFEIEQRWMVNGRHYQRTLEAWLERLDSAADLGPILSGVYGQQASGVWRQRWRIFLMACSELFGYRGGTEWHVAHYRLAA